MNYRIERRSKTKIPLTTDFTNHTDERKPNSTIRAIREIRGPEHPWFKSSGAKHRLRAQIGRSSGAKCREVSSPQVVPSIRVRVQYKNLRAQRAQNPGTASSG
jgi:hypothetical protein